ncbi:PQQ-dependent sugar dehydrogenase [Pedobacter sandarakinus]|uniref:PQQ-dependent sugar dehydrogenase n=1 Tax=Pedobacter sandarakinus TaxID=353156 RepID=UPI002246A920|nr:PQQ-dependent sugar dehydrogenase [Pedobacter sandarakinus]MCX2575288.1 PQQ-dependent sugar dehydrogenase [Pedobacter sandarakinus]
MLARYKILAFLLISCWILAAAFINRPYHKANAETGYEIDTLAENLRVPWEIVFLPNKDILFTEREGRVRLIKEGKLVAKPIFNLNDIALRNKTGALGLCLHPAFAENGIVYLASNYLLENRMRLRIVRYKFTGDSLINPLIMLKDLPASQNHTGCRLVFGPDRKLYITTGDADQPMLAQDLKAYNGKILRMNDDGTIPADNPFFKNDTARKEIWSYGHRNPQGLAFQSGSGALYESEHGPTGGDEINIIKKGSNYGWPVAHHDIAKPGMVSPLIQYTPSIGPGEAMFYTGNQFPALRNKLLVACLRGEAVYSFSIEKEKITNQITLFQKQFGRVRSMVTGPDGYIYLSTSMHDPGEGHPRDAHDDMILRLRPSGTTLAYTSNNAKAKLQQSAVVNGTPGRYQQLCASCHGDKLQGTNTAKGFINTKFLYGSDKKSIVTNITNGIVEKGMPAWNGAIDKKDIDKLADYIIAAAKKK